MHTSRAAVIAAFAAVYIIWGSTYLAIRFTLETLPPLLTAGLRFFIAGLVLFAYIRFKERGPAPSLRNWGAAAVVGALLLLGGNGCVVWAEHTVPSGMAALFIATVPLWMVLLEWLWFKGAAPAGGQWLGIGVGFLGVWLLIAPDILPGHMPDAPQAGLFALLLASLSWSFGSVMARRLPLPSSSFLATGMEMMAGGALLFAAGLVQGEVAMVHPEHFSLKSLAAFGYLIVFGSLCGFTAYIWLLKHVGVAKTSTYAFVNPVVAVFLGWLLAGEQLTSASGVAAALIVAAVVLITWSAGRKHRKNP